MNLEYIGDGFWMDPAMPIIGRLADFQRINESMNEYNLLMRRNAEKKYGFKYSDLAKAS